MEGNLPRSARPVPTGHVPRPPMYLLARRETRFLHSNTCCLSSKSVKRPEGLPISSKPAATRVASHRSPAWRSQVGTEAALSGQPGGPRRTRPRRDREASGTRATWQLTWDKLVLPEKVQVPIQVGEVVAQALPGQPPVEQHSVSGGGAGPGAETAATLKQLGNRRGALQD